MPGRSELCRLSIQVLFSTSDDDDEDDNDADNADDADDDDNAIYA